MLPQVKTKTQKLEKYQGIISDKLFQELFQEVKNLSRKLKGIQVAMINSTPRGGGVAEVLKSLIPLMKGMGIQAKWYCIPPGRKFFGLTKEIHNALQGKKFSLSFSSRRLYHRYMEKSAKMMLDMKADIWVLHDPQPAGIVQYLSDKDFHPIISRIHIDTSNPNSEAWNFIKGFLLEYDKIIFSSEEFVHFEIPKEKRLIFPPAIDPLTEKNKSLPASTAKTILQGFGINSNKPLVAQISRFDPWKDPIGVIKAYQSAKKKIPDLQLALVGLFLAHDDPEAIKVFKETKKEANNDPDIFLFSNPAQLGSLTVDRFVNAFQTGADVVLQKSIREGFGLSATEAMWKGKPVIGGNVGGIKLQIKDGKNGFLVSSPKEASQRIIELIKDKNLQEKLGKAAKETVRQKFLIPRLLRDYLKLFKKILK
jgi:trehalose synthase